MCVCLTPLQSKITFDPEAQTWKKGFLPNISPPGVWGQGVVSYLFGKGRMRQIKCWERNFDFQLTSLENGARR